MTDVKRFFADTAVNVTEECVLAADYDALGERIEEHLQRVGQLESELVEWKKMRNEAMAAATANRERITQLESALLTPKAAEWKYLDDGVTLLKAALNAIPERYRDGEPNQLHDAIKEWLSRPERAALAPKEPT